jgi:hypothetical protein
MLALFAFPEAVFMSMSRIHGLSLLYLKATTYTGFTPREDPIATHEWVDGVKEPTFNLKGDEVHEGFVIYYSAPATQHTVAMNMMPSQTFGNFSAAQPHKLKPLDFATHREATLGGKDATSN